MKYESGQVMIGGKPLNRFVHHSKKNLIHIGRNLYINPCDPLYCEKILEYIDPQSAEAHLRLGERNEEKGFLSTALFHYKEVTRFDSPYYTRAKKATDLIENRTNYSLSHSEPCPKSNPNRPATSTNSDIPIYLKSLIVFLLLFNSALIFLIYGLSQS
jgi:hypothetical protein